MEKNTRLQDKIWEWPGDEASPLQDFISYSIVLDEVAPGVPILRPDVADTTHIRWHYSHPLALLTSAGTTHIRWHYSQPLALLTSADTTHIRWHYSHPLALLTSASTTHIRWHYPHPPPQIKFDKVSPDRGTGYGYLDLSILGTTSHTRGPAWHSCYSTSALHKVKAWGWN